MDGFVFCSFLGIVYFISFLLCFIGPYFYIHSLNISGIFFFSFHSVFVHFEEIALFNFPLCLHTIKNEAVLQSMV
ncbi:hypothetical protein BDF14DRAFT_1754122 [Spinellus fusiger]|nr:hypothetical protein BDF14DRAFT_1754122 [Spinellus fusiger]